MNTARLLALCLLLAAGCSDGPRFKKVYAVKGKVTHRGQAVGNATLNFAPVGGGKDATFATAQTDAEGKFTLSTYKKDDGAPAGEYAVTVYWPDNGPSVKKVRAAAGEELAPDRFRGAYSDPSKSPLRATVEGKSNDLVVEIP